MDSKQIFTEQMVLPYSAMAANNHIRLDRILTLFQDAAAMHALALGVSGQDLEKIGFKWLISRYQIRVHESLQLAQSFTLKTWRLPWKNLYELRQFTIENTNGSLVISALGVWVMVNAANSKPVRLTPNMPADLMAKTATAPDLWPNNPDLSEYDQKKQFHVRMHDLDLNQHVNHTVYVTWAMESLPISWLFRHTPRTLVVSYLKESFYPDVVVVKTSLSDTAGSLKTCHAIFHEASGARLACLTLTWSKISHGPV
ncbi:MAG: hypothetical protein LC660_03275 [Desulfobacteraceae bacterium]|nr:hypothetical protein [Desulfobacteraceae bacterium]